MHATFSRLINILIFALAVSFSVSAADKNKDREKVTLNFVGADIQSVVKSVSLITGKNFILDPRVSGTVNIISANPVDKDLVYPILLSALRLQGFTAVEGPGVIKIVPEADAKLNNSPTVEGSTSKFRGDQLITQVFALKHESAAQLLPVLRPLIAPNNVINAYPNNNTLVITDYAENLKRISKIIDSIDVAPNTEIDVIRLKYASAIEISQLLPRLMPEAGAQQNIPGGQPKLALAVDARINGLIVRGENQAMLTKVRKLVESLDVETSETGNIRVVYLRNAEAVKVAETLRGILGGGTGGGNSQPIPQPVAQPVPGQPGAQGVAAAIVNIPQTSGGGTIQAYAATNSLVIVAPDYVYNGLRGVIDKLDARRAQVFVEALIVEVSTNKASEFGIQWQDLSGANDTGVRGVGGTNFNTGGTNNNIGAVAANIGGAGPGFNIGIIKGRINIPGIGEIFNLGILARALEADGNVNILSTPNILTIDNEEAKIVVGQNVPFITGTQTATTGGLANPFQTIERKDVGLQLKVKPSVSEGGTVKLTLSQEVSSLGANSTAGFITNKRSIDSTILVDDGQIVVLGGLIQDEVRVNVDQVPVLGNIPLLGNLFKYEKRTRDKVNLMVFIRPVILRDPQAPQQITNERYDYIRNEQGLTKPEHRWVIPDMPVPQLPAIPPAPMPKQENRNKKSSTAPLTKVPQSAVAMPLISAPAPESTETEDPPPVERKRSTTNVRRDPLKPVQP